MLSSAHMGPLPDAAGAARPLAPRDPETFYHAQKRNRRATWRMSFLCFVAALLMGIPLTLVLTPLFYAGTMIVVEIINYFSPLPADFRHNLTAPHHLPIQVAHYFINHQATLHHQNPPFGLP